MRGATYSSPVAEFDLDFENAPGGVLIFERDGRQWIALDIDGTIFQFTPEDTRLVCAGFQKAREALI